MGKIGREWQDTDSVLSYFGDERKNCVERYEKFVFGGVTEGKRPDLVGGGLLRSSGGWSAVLSLRRKGRRVAYDERVLGSSEFVQKLLSEAEEKEKQSLRLITKIPGLAFLVVQIAKGEGIDEALLRSGTRKRLVARTRKLFCQIAVGKLGYSGAEVARFLGVTTSCVNRLAASEEIPEISRYL